MIAQIQIIQFVFLFLIGLTIFSSVVVFLYSYGNYAQSRAIFSYEKLVGTYISSAFTDLIVYCKFCNYSLVNLTIPRKIIEDVYEINLDYFYVKSILYNKEEEIRHHNLNYTYVFSGSTVSESKIIQITPDFLLPFSILSISFNRTSRKITIF